MHKLDLLETKLHPPPHPTQWIDRPDLLQRLHEGLELKRQLTLVSAPAGFGKTTCISAWVNTLDSPPAWFSLDAGDDDPVRFFSYFVAALQRVEAHLGHEIEGVLRAGQLPPAEVISAIFINDISQRTERFLLVLDDFHVIQDRFILRVLQQLVTNQPPALHLVLITREDPLLPLARLRASNRLTEIRARDLRFSGQETADFLHNVLAFPLSEANVAALEDKTEGWVAGLQLAALSMRGQNNASAFIAGLSGSHRPILGYLTEQVLDQQPEEIRQFMLQTAILDRLNGDLCNEVCQRSDGRALLERLFKANLFLIPLDDAGLWYRYHHMFADLLRDRQRDDQGQETAEYHRRASHWYARAGMASEAIQHALAAPDYDLAVELLESHALPLINHGYAKTVNGWVQAIPGQWQLKSPKANLALAWMHLLQGAYGEASPYLERLEAILSNAQVEAGDKKSIRAEWLVMQSLLLNHQGERSESLAAAQDALATVPQEDSRVQSLVHFGLAYAYETNKNDQQAVAAYQMALQYARAAGNPVVEMLSTSALCLDAFEKGQLHLAGELATAMVERIERSGSLPPISALIYGILGEVYYHWGQVRRGRECTQQALRLCTLGGYQSGIISCRVLLSRLFQLEVDLPAAAEEMQEAAGKLRVDTPDYIRQETIAQQVRLYLDRNLPHAAKMALQSEGFLFKDEFVYPTFLLETGLSHASGLLVNSSLRTLLHEAGSGRDPTLLQPGIALANEVVTVALHGRTFIVVLETLLLRAQMHAALGDIRASEADYARALELAEPEGFTSVFIEQGPSVITALSQMARQDEPPTVSPETIEQILSSAARLRTPTETLPESPLVEPLSERELEVLRLMAGGLKYKEIAGRLVISLNTVRYHVKAIYSKLGVNNRTQAIARARRLHIL